MVATAKVASAIFTIVFIAIAILIRHQEAGFRHYYKHDYENARIALTPMAENGDPLASYYLGHIFRQGWGTDQNRASAKSWFLRSARKGFVNGAVMYLNTDLSDERYWSDNCSSIYKLLTAAARAKNILAILSLANYYARELCGKLDLVKSAIFYTLASDLNKIFQAKSKVSLGLLSLPEQIQFRNLLNIPVRTLSEQQFLDEFIIWIEASTTPGHK